MIEFPHKLTAEYHSLCIVTRKTQIVNKRLQNRNDQILFVHNCFIFGSQGIFIIIIGLFLGCCGLLCCPVRRKNPENAGITRKIFSNNGKFLNCEFFS